MYNETIKERLTNLRIESGLSQEKLSEKTGIPHHIIAKIEAGYRQPDTETVGKLAEFHDVSIDYIYGLGKKHK